MRLMGLVVFAAIVSLIAAPAIASAAPTTTPTAPSANTGGALVDTVLNTLAGIGGSSDGPATPSKTSQMIVVTAPKATDTTATLTAFEKSADGKWSTFAGPVKAFLGSQGMGEPKDNVPRTPEGTFALDQAFGRDANPGTKMPYFQATTADWWDSNMKSPTYNTHVKGKSPGGDSENLYNSGPVYDYAVNIAHNPQRTPGKASAMFLHVTNGEPTLGCVAIDKASMKKILAWLDPAKEPKITIGVNKGAPTADAPGTTTPGGANSNGILTGLANSLLSLIPSILGTAAGS
ncbi:L,D-transpeptidase family protein [Gordonia sp. CPCC 205333]|uniref:L,D-transpeptidase family protein n=1 Tax=Gordonia sp. CPCC 205333 TaxID=3140790 RepID=UPI003AF37E84